MTARVTVIVPVYNSAPYVGDCLRSVLEQTISAEDVEIIAVDDGSTDGSDQVLAQLAEQHDRITVISQENSGTPGGARNPALDRASGEFVFFLDSDDLLDPDALQDMVEVAEREHGDVVLGRIVSLDERRAPASMFSSTVLDAHVLESKIFNTLGPTKLIRRSLIESLALRFPVDQQVGEDQPFMAAVYLNARKISILADHDYYYVRSRDDKSNMTLTRQSARSHLVRAMRLAAVIEQYTDPGELRDGVLRRPFGRSLAKTLDARWLTESRETRAELADTARSALGHLYTDGARDNLAATVRNKLDLLFSGELEGLRRYIEYRSSNTPRTIEWHDGAFRVRLPEDLAPFLTAQQRAAPAPAFSCRLDDLAVEGTATTISASVDLGDLHGVPDEVVLRLTQRRGDRRDEVPVRTEPGDDATGRLRFVAVVDDPGRGVWDVHVRLRIGTFEKVLRLGRDRVRTLEPEGASNLAEQPRPEDSIVAYYTQDYGNLSIDRGMTLHPDADTAEVLGLTLDENGRCIALVQMSRPYGVGDEFFGTWSGIHQHGGRHLLPCTRIGERLLGVRLPLSADTVGATFELSSALGGALSPLPVVGADYWPARAAGYGLDPIAGGGVRVIAPDQQRSPGPPTTAPPARGSARAVALRTRIRARAGALPVIGPALGAVARRLRGR